MATNVQQLVQGLTPPATPSGPTQGMPVNWTLGNLPSYQPFDWQKLAGIAPQPTDQFKGFGLSTQAPSPTPPAPPMSTPTPPQVTPSLPPVGTGGNLPPHQGIPRFDPNNTLFQNGSGKGWAYLGQTNPELSAGFTTDSNGGQSKGSILNSLHGLGGLDVNLGDFGKQLASTGLGRALGVASDGSFNLVQALDWILPGNLYMAQTGQTNFANIIPALFSAINPLLGFGVTKLMDTFGAKYENTPDDQLNWLQKLLKNRYVKNKANRNAGRGGNLNPNQGPNPFIGGGFGTPFFGNFHDQNTGHPTVTIGGPGSDIGVMPGSTPGDSYTSGGTYTPGSNLNVSNPNFQIRGIGPPHVGGSNLPDGSTNGFNYAFQGGGDLPDLRNFVKLLNQKAGNATK